MFACKSKILTLKYKLWNSYYASICVCVCVCCLQIINVLIFMPALHIHVLSRIYIKELAQATFKVCGNISTKIYLTGLRLDLKIPMIKFTSKSCCFEWGVQV